MKNTITDRDLDFAYDVLIATVLCMLAMATIAKLIGVI